jgi:hypothetical protein
MNVNNKVTPEGIRKEYDVLNGALDIAIQRLQGGENVPEYMNKTLNVWTRAFMITAKSVLPEGEMRDKLSQLGENFKTYQKAYQD